MMTTNVTLTCPQCGMEQDPDPVAIDKSKTIVCWGCGHPLVSQDVDKNG